MGRSGSKREVGLENVLVYWKGSQTTGRVRAREMGGKGERGVELLLTDVKFQRLFNKICQTETNE